MNDQSEPRLFCFGLGYTARRFAARLMARGWRVAGTTRGPETARELMAAGIEAHLFDRERPLADAWSVLAETTHLLSSIAPDEAGDPVLDSHGAEIRRLSGRLTWIGYLSTTGVYGDRQGGTVDEESELRPTSRRAERRVAAERACLDLAEQDGLPVQIFRLAGIYGPGRSTFDAIRAGRARRIDRPEQKFSRIHVDDIARVLEASLARPRAGRIYNVCDQEPAAPAEVVAYACELLGVTPPGLVSFEEAGLGEMARSFWRDNKRVDNTRMREELGVQLAHPTYREGLAAILAEERRQAGPAST